MMKLLKDSGGQVLVETAITLPILLALLFAIVDFGRLLYAKNTLDHAVRSGARIAVVTPSLSPIPPTPLSSAANEPGSTIQNALAQITTKGTNMTYEVKIFNSSGGVVTGIAHAGDQVNVIVQVDNFSMITPLWKYISSQSGTFSLNSQSVMRYE